MKMLIAVPCMDQVPAMFAQSLAMLNKVGETKLSFQVGSLIYTSRNSLATTALRMDADWVFWLDSDMVFKPDTLERLWKTAQEKDLDFVSGLYFRRVAPYSPVLFDKIEIEGELCSWSQFKEIPQELFKIGACGFGCVLMKTDILLDVQAKHGNMFAPIGNTGEDVAFCWRARDCGYDLWCDPSVVCGHIGHIVVDDKFYTSFKAQKV